MDEVYYSSSTFSRLHQTLRKDILNAPKSMPNLRKEISRLFQVANRRIQNIENSGVISPAVLALNKGDVKGFSKFRMRGHNWDDLKTEYSKVVTFLQQPTSTLRGTREYNEHIKEKYDLDDKEYELIKDNIEGKLQSISDSDYVERYLMRYKDFTGDIETEALSLASQLENDSQDLSDMIEKDLIDDAIKARDKESKNAKELKNVIDFLDEHGLL